MATLPTSTKSLAPLITPTAPDPTAQKLAELEARIAQLESALIVSAVGAITLKSSSTISIEAGSSMTLKSSAGMTMQASGVMTVKGATINLN